MIGPSVRGEFADSVDGYLDTPTMGVPPLRAVRRLGEAMGRWTRGEADFEEWERDGEACRRRFAAWMGVGANEVALVPSVVPAAAAVAETLRDRGRAIVAHPSEYRSLLLPFLTRFQDDRVRWVEGPYTADAFARAIGPGVTAVVASSVSSADGARLDLGALVEASQAVGAVVVIDATQSVGTASLGVSTDSVAALFAAGYKGLLGPRGTAYAYVRPDLEITPFVTPSPYGMADAQTAGAYGPPVHPKEGAASLDQSPAWLSWVGALPALEWICSSADADREAHTTSLAEQLRHGLSDLGLEPQPTDRPSPIVSVAVERPESVIASLAAGGIRAAVRRGRLRFGFHVYNTSGDVTAVLAGLASSTAQAPA
jgi:selenocysteine lyase/cysteine desulfurase